MQTLEELFTFFDENQDGVISKSELINLVEVLLDERGLGASTKILKEYDLDQNGLIDFIEFKNFAHIHLGIKE
ncbi:MAG: EF-hand domain-containing protein [Pseudoalteromonas nigrifaciens]|uniref:EF-hand domain-containing protein n=1 Tax=Pseudoalteromonas nigrifaciens TaxID=28109 RepID=UPI003C70B3B0